jgi:hypothetical protein
MNGKYAVWQFAARFLKIGPESYWPVASELSMPPEPKEEVNLLLEVETRAPLVQQLARWYVGEKLSLNPTGVTGSQVRRVADGVKNADLTAKSIAFGDTAREALDLLRASATANVTVRGSSRPAFHFTCAFLGIDFPCEFLNVKWRPVAWINRFKSEWLRVPGDQNARSENATRGDSEPFDPKLATETQYRVASSFGCARKTGGHRENRGHN